MIRFLLVCAAGVSLAGAIASADALMIALDSPTLMGSPGDTLQFFGTITNTTIDPIFLNGDNFNLAAFDPSVIDDTPFFLNAPLSLDGGTSSGDLELFDIDIPSSFTPGGYDGTFQILGGGDASQQVLQGSASFTVDVQQTSGVPEPSAGIMTTLGLIMLASGYSWRFRRTLLVRRVTESPRSPARWKIPQLSKPRAH